LPILFDHKIGDFKVENLGDCESILKMLYPVDQLAQEELFDEKNQMSKTS
jgi:hypothetical protein